jgi:putative holliday junction resolvase
MAQPVATSNIVALDVGMSRIGVAVASPVAKLARPLITLQHDEGVYDRICQLLEAEGASELVVGLPRNLNGEPTPQTATVKQFVANLQLKIALPVHWQDEALTSVKAKEELEHRGKPYQKADIDALAATYILEDYLQTRELAVNE